MSEPAQSPEGRASVRRIRFVDATMHNDLVLMKFKDPAPRYALRMQDEL